MKYLAANYKHKHFILIDEGDEDENGIDPFVDVDKIVLNKALLTQHVRACRYYGIPAYIGKDIALNTQIGAIDRLLDMEAGYE